MLTRVSDDVLTHQSSFMQTNSIVVLGPAGVLLVDAGVRTDELADLANDLRDHAVVAGFSTHPHWDHLLWHSALGDAPRYGTEQCAAAITARLSTDGWQAMVAGMIPGDIAAEVPIDDHFGRITGLSASLIPWDGPDARIIEHRAHAPGHAALVVGDVLIAGDMLSDILVPTLNGFAADPIGDYLAALDLLEQIGADFFVPGHGSVGDAAELRTRIARDRAYFAALREGRMPDDPRLDATTEIGAAMAALTERQLQSLA